MARPDTEALTGAYDNGFRRKELEEKFPDMAERWELLNQIPSDYIDMREYWNSGKRPKEIQEILDKIEATLN